MQRPEIQIKKARPKQLIEELMRRGCNEWGYMILRKPIAYKLASLVGFEEWMEKEPDEIEVPNWLTLDWATEEQISFELNQRDEIGFIVIKVTPYSDQEEVAELCKAKLKGEELENYDEF